MCPLPDIVPDHPAGIRNVLVVDDEPTLRLGFHYALSGPDTRVDTAPGGAAALALMADRPYDVVFLDLRMPEIDGLRVIQTLRETGNSVPVILCSAFVTLEAILMSVRNRVVDFLVKPVTPSDLRYALAYVTGDPQDRIATAIRCARLGKTEDAIGLLGDTWASTDELCRLWRTILQCSARDAGPGELRSAVGDRVLEKIALHAGA